MAENADQQKVPSLCAALDGYALNKSKDSGLLSATGQKVYALYYLNGGRQQLESDELKAALPNVLNRAQSLAEVLVNFAETQN